MIRLLKKYRKIGLVGSIHSAKSSLALHQLLEIKKTYNTPIYILGVEPSLYPYLKSKGFNILYSKEDILDLRIKNAIIYIDEFGDLFKTASRDKQLERLIKFFNRIAHLNDYLIISTARQGFWNKFMCGLIRCFVVKKIEFNELVNGTDLKRKIMSITENNSEYRLDCKTNTFYIISPDENIVKRTFRYNSNIDPKKDNVDIFKVAVDKQKNIKKVKEKVNRKEKKKGERKDEITIITTKEEKGK